MLFYIIVPIVLLVVIVLCVRLYQLYKIQKAEREVVELIRKNCAELVSMINRYEGARHDAEIARLVATIADGAEEASRYRYYAPYSAELQNNARILRAVLKPGPPISTLHH